MKKGAYYITRLLLLLYIAAVAMLCFMHFDSGVDFSKTLFGFQKDKVAHFLMFFPYPSILFMTFFKRTWKAGHHILFYLIIIASGAALGGGIELLQGLTDYRSCDLNDFYADCAGLGCGLAVPPVLTAITRKKTSHE